MSLVVSFISWEPLSSWRQVYNALCRYGSNRQTTKASFNMRDKKKSTATKSTYNEAEQKWTQKCLTLTLPLTGWAGEQKCCSCSLYQQLEGQAPPFVSPYHLNPTWHVWAQSQTPPLWIYYSATYKRHSSPPCFIPPLKPNEATALDPHNPILTNTHFYLSNNHFTIDTQTGLEAGRSPNTRCSTLWDGLCYFHICK